ncbi:hypothetical protein [Bacillus pinisoli]|uniref:hypothetical protein n=1 Tax=Bacillus pinisoli TaxID=2901866 RepID=UPI001FF33BE4|nr:hypothetical protein [Bacillus pinisoli]
MTKQIDCALYQDLYELYKEGEVEEETVDWMKMHEKSCIHCLAIKEKVLENKTVDADYQKIRSIRLLTIGMYSFFMFISMWMSLWYFL